MVPRCWHNFLSDQAAAGFMPRTNSLDGDGQFVPYCTSPDSSYTPKWDPPNPALFCTTLPWMLTCGACNVSIYRCWVWGGLLPWLKPNQTQNSKELYRAVWLCKLQTWVGTRAWMRVKDRSPWHRLCIWAPPPKSCESLEKLFI